MFRKWNVTLTIVPDTGDNVITQISGYKTALLWDPVHSRELYADYHDMYGISPVNTKQVDTARHPHFAKVPSIPLHPI